jgi:hypothetical protein
VAPGYDESMEAAFSRVDDVLFREISSITTTIRPHPPGGQLRGRLESQRAPDEGHRVAAAEKAAGGSARRNAPAPPGDSRSQSAGRIHSCDGRRSMRRRTVTIVCGAASLLLGACDGASPQSFGTTPSPSQSGGPGQPSQTLPADNVVKASEADNGRTVVIHVGDRLSVALNSTYWSFGGTSDSAVLSFEGPAVVAASPSGCVPGGGCGSITASFSARSPRGGGDNRTPGELRRGAALHRVGGQLSPHGDGETPLIPCPSWILP